ncbi:MAG: xanthine dehydrogenase accessory protein XdhC [Bdellovibrionales bacterium]|nr:xanthine dehydrogenase accessory protein XdhC [Bdellovibrionales bacterium]
MRHFTEAQELSRACIPFVVVTLVGVRGGAPSEPGAKAIVTKEGLHCGTVGGGKIEARCIREAQRMLAEKERAPWLATWNLQRDIGMTCGGETTYLFEPHAANAWEIAVFGAGHVAQALVRTLLPLSCRITCVDPRKEWISRLPAAANLVALREENPPDLVGRFPSSAFFVVMTQGHATDMPILREIFRLHPSAPYIGAMGSKAKAGKMRRELAESGVPPDLVERLRAPIGLPIGGNEPEEIAISVAAELLGEKPRISR